MANENNIGGILSTENPQITSNGLSIPASFNATRSPKLLTLFERNSNLLYTKYSYYNPEEGNGSNSQQPFFAVNPDNIQLGELKSNSTLNSRKKTDSRTLPFVSSDEDVIRMRKFLRTSTGNKFTTTQLLLQGLQPFNETKIYNPLMPIIASARPGTLGLLSRPTRFIELNAGGIFGALGLKAVSTVLFGNSNPTPPPGTATGRPATFFNSINPFSSRLPGALPVNRQDGGKGLTRGKSASDAYKNFTDYWSPTSRGLVGKLLSTVSNYIRGSTAVGALVPIGQPRGTVFKADESSYDLMIKNGIINQPYSRPGLFGRVLSAFLGSSPSIPRFVWVDANNTEQYGLRQKWAGGTIKGSVIYRYAVLNVLNDLNGLVAQPKTDKKTVFEKYKNVIVNPVVNPSKRESISGGGYQVLESKEQSEILANYSDYINNIRGTNPVGVGAYPTKFADNPQSPSYELLAKDSVFSRYKSNSWEKLKNQKSIKPSDPSFVGPSTLSILNNDEDYNDSTYIKRFAKDNYRKQLLDLTIEKGGKGLLTTRGDELNKFSVLNEDELGAVKDADLIRFWFYDIANEKYIPFRATVKSINERYTSDWDNFQYIGNADKVYNYKGFTRSLGFSFSVVSTSVEELQPMWSRINYLLGLSKPARYLNNNFIVPPLVKLTIGDMYRDQPLIITNMSLSIPDNATWETLPSGTEYNYNFENTFDVNKNGVAQMPMEADLTIDCNILEVQKPQVMNSNNFGWGELVTK